MQRGCVAFDQQVSRGSEDSRRRLDFIRPLIGSAQLGVLPYLDLSLEEEDRVRFRRCDSPEIDIAVLYLPHIANATDLEPLSVEENVRVRFVRHADELGAPDAIIIPGSKNTIWDLQHLRRCGLADELLLHAGKTPLIGICGGFEMLGGQLFDPDQTESGRGIDSGSGGFWRSTLRFSATSWFVRVAISRAHTVRFSRGRGDWIRNTHRQAAVSRGAAAV